MCKDLTEGEMIRAVIERFGAHEQKYAACEVPISAEEVERQLYGDSRLDLVEYDTASRVFKVTEFKVDHHQSAISHAFRPVERYRRALKANPYAFLDAFTRKSPMRFRRLMESTCGATKISVEFYVGLTDEACKESDFLRAMKAHYRDTGIIRVKDNGTSKDYLKNPDGTRDYDIARATADSFSLTWPQAASNVNGTEQAPVVPSENALCPAVR